MVVEKCYMNLVNLDRICMIHSKVYGGFFFDLKTINNEVWQDDFSFSPLDRFWGKTNFYFLM